MCFQATNTANVAAPVQSVDVKQKARDVDSVYGTAAADARRNKKGARTVAALELTSDLAYVLADFNESAINGELRSRVEQFVRDFK